MIDKHHIEIRQVANNQEGLFGEAALILPGVGLKPGELSLCVFIENGQLQWWVISWYLVSPFAGFQVKPDAATVYSKNFFGFNTCDIGFPMCLDMTLVDSF